MGFNASGIGANCRRIGKYAGHADGAAENGLTALGLLHARAAPYEWRRMPDQVFPRPVLP